MMQSAMEFYSLGLWSENCGSFYEDGEEGKEG